MWKRIQTAIIAFIVGIATAALWILTHTPGGRGADSNFTELRTSGDDVTNGVGKSREIAGDIDDEVKKLGNGIEASRGGLSKLQETNKRLAEFIQRNKK